MRCEEVIRQLEASPGNRDSAGLAEHVSGCPSCATLAAGLDRFGRLWNATRATDPSAETWERLWAGVSDRLGQVATPATSTSALACGTEPGEFSGVVVPGDADRQTRPWKTLGVVGIIGLAQAAALLFAISTSWHSGMGSRPKASPTASRDVVRRPLPVRIDEVDVEEGRLVLIRSQSDKLEVVDIDGRETLGGVDAWYFWYNVVESMDRPTIASAE